VDSAPSVAIRQWSAVSSKAEASTELQYGTLIQLTPRIFTIYASIELTSWLSRQGRFLCAVEYVSQLSFSICLPLGCQRKVWLVELAASRAAHNMIRLHNAPNIVVMIPTVWFSAQCAYWVMGCLPRALVNIETLRLLALKPHVPIFGAKKTCEG
jgi:hypothetical protein